MSERGHHELKANDLIVGAQPLVEQALECELSRAWAELAALKTRAPEPKPERKPRPDGHLFSPDEAAAYLGVSIKTFRSLRIPSITPGQGRVKPHRRYARADLDRFVEQQRQQEAMPCPSAKSPIRRTTTTSSRSEVVDIAARLIERASRRQKR